MQETLKKLRTSLQPIYGKNESEAIIRLIFHYVKGWDLTDMLIHQQDLLSPFVKEEINEILKRLLKNEPIQYIVGEARFHGLDFKIRPGVLIPRRETEELTDIIIDQNKNRDDLKIIDLCTGSGCMAIALARNLPFSDVTAIDISDEALDVARENSSLLKTKIKVEKGNVLDPLWEPSQIPPGGYDIIVSNPPYVMDHEALTMDKNVLNYEPHEALFVRDENPLEFYSAISDFALKFLAKDGKLYFEINPLTASALKQMLEAKGFDDVEVINDSFGKKRFISCARKR